MTESWNFKWKTGEGYWNFLNYYYAFWERQKDQKKKKKSTKTQTPGQVSLWLIPTSQSLLLFIARVFIIQIYIWDEDADQVLRDQGKCLFFCKWTKRMEAQIVEGFLSTTDQAESQVVRIYLKANTFSNITNRTVASYTLCLKNLKP